MWKLGRLLTMFRKELLLAWTVLRDPRAPKLAKLVTVLAALYVVSPIDLVSDFIPVLGYLDDIILLPALITLTVRFIPQDIFERYRAEAKEMWANGKPKKWYYALPIVVIWLLAFWLIIKSLLFRNILYKP